MELLNEALTLISSSSLRSTFESLDARFPFAAGMVLIGNGAEFRSRLMHRRFLEIFAAAPIGGFSSYLDGSEAMAEASKRVYFDPKINKRAPLRNMRVDGFISLQHLLRPRQVTDHTIKAVERGSGLLSKFTRYLIHSEASVLLFLLTWIIFAGLIVLAVQLPSVSWIGLSNIIALGLWSICVRAIDRVIWVPGRHKPTNPKRPDAIVFLGNRTSAFILRGSREDIARWSGSSLERRESATTNGLSVLVQAGSICLLAMIFSTVPNGTTQDQLLFIAYNLLGQAHTWLSLRLHSRDMLRKLTAPKTQKITDRTSLAAFLIRTFGDDTWVDEANLVPKDLSWQKWRKQILENPPRDAKLLWEDIDRELQTGLPSPPLSPTMDKQTTKLLIPDRGRTLQDYSHNQDPSAYAVSSVA